MIKEIKPHLRAQNIESSSQNPFLKITLSDQIMNRNFDSINQKNQKKQTKISCEHVDYVQSMQRRLQFQRSKQEELNLILSKKLQSEIDFLKEENINLKNINKDLTKKLEQNLLNTQKSSARSFGNQSHTLVQVSNLKNMLASLEKQHEHCITVKKELLDIKQTVEMKIKILEEEKQQLQYDCKQYKRKTQSFNEILAQNESYKNDIEILIKQIQYLKILNQQQEIQFSEQLSALQKAIYDLQTCKKIQESEMKNTQIHSKSPQKTTSHMYKPSKLSTQSYIKFQDDNLQRKSFSSQNNFFSQKSYLKNSFHMNFQNKYKDEKTIREKQIIEGLYKKNLNILKNSSQLTRPQKSNCSNNGRKQAILKSEKENISNVYLPYYEQRTVNQDQWVSKGYKQSSQNKRRFKYL